MDAHLAHLAQAGYSPQTIYGRRRALARFLACGGCVERFRGGLPASLYSAHDELSHVRSFLTWAGREGEAEAIRLPRLPEPVPLTPPSRDDVRRFLAALVPRSPAGLRDRAIVELIYSSALRACEVRRLKLADVDLAKGVVRVRGKGGRERIAPLGAAASGWLSRYLASARPLLRPRTDSFFASGFGRPLDYTSVVTIFDRRRGRVTTSVKITAHALRRAAAAHCQAAGMNVRELQEFLGHADLKSIDRYTGVRLEELRAVLERCHPRCAMRLE